MHIFRDEEKMTDSDELHIVTGVSGRTGAAAARALLQTGKRVRVVVRNNSKAGLWAGLGAEVALADFNDPSALSCAFADGDHAYIISPPQYASNDLFEQAEAMADNLAEATANAQLKKIVALSSIGADKPDGTGWIAMNRTLEKYLGQTGLPVTFLRAAYFMENWSPLVQATSDGQLPSFLAPLTQKLPMIATADIGRIAAEALSEDWENIRIIELEGPARYSPEDVANSLARTTGQRVDPIALPESAWRETLADAGFSAVALKGFIEMTRALNSGHICFSRERTLDHRSGNLALDTVIATMVSRG